ncbi:alpha-hydroxy acid oxidase [Novosphingobium sp. Leaf2]|uniref:alpha-hydroxy acid oxidase n=1 Tax=Novosphingobium sp. Leaf2 TaxID=1735670 RepID=UPI0007012022|nr:alpha-hydroxy acid oxidase [Novosphingobium sp. Leaf2]KQM19743.1 2-hydroxy-acid oxidase [Novosphingobium sp. Leaf2]
MTGPKLAPLHTIPPDLCTLDDYADRAQAHMDPAVWRHVQEGAGREITLRRNREVFDSIGLLPRGLADVSGSTRIELLGRTHAAPIMLAPLAYQRLAHSDGELAVVRAATAMDTGMVLSTLSSVTLEDVAAAAQALTAQGEQAGPSLWFQLYQQPQRENTLALVRRAEAAGYEAIVLTIDAGLKPAGISLPDGVAAANLAGMPRPRHTATPGGRILMGTSLTNGVPGWPDLAWLRAATTLPIIVKGLLLGEDAARAVDEGVDALIVSNHGGRVLDGVPSAMEVLPAIAEATGNRIPLLLDGGVRSGTDVIKALALGARAVLIGRPQMHALAVAGMPGVAHMLHILRTELEAAMVQLGCPQPGMIGPERLISF